MGLYVLENNEICIAVNSHGAELRSLKDKDTGREYMWCGDAAYWGRISPVLFPVVGCYRDKECRHEGVTYSLPQHGFARDMEFALLTQNEDELRFRLTDTEETRENYPFVFDLEITYRLLGRSVQVIWEVQNPADETMHFSIGGHPAFAAPAREPEKTTCYIEFAGAKSLQIRKINDGLATDEVQELSLLEGGILPVTEEVFADDALVVEGNQTGRVSLLNENREKYLTVSFNAPLFGVWTPPGKNAPFICIEPWYGRCDKEDFAGELSEREWGNTLAGGELFRAAYTIEV